MSVCTSGSFLSEGNDSGDSSRESGIEESQKLGAVGELKQDDYENDESKDNGRSFSIGPENFEGFSSEEISFTSVGSAETVSGSRKNDCDGNTKKNVKKLHAFDSAVAQDRRRKETLQWQKQRRDEILEKIRQLEDSAYSDSETEDEMDFAQNVRQTSSGALCNELEEINEEASSQEMEVVSSSSKKSRGRKKSKVKQLHSRYRQAPCGPMLSEWLLEKPDDFEDKWLGVICPVGKRCIVMASRGKTKIFSRSNQYLGSYKSLLPGGCRYNYRDTTTNRNRGVTILDCIWSPQSETFYVLDMVCWNSHSCVNCDTDYRQFFLHSKFSENLELLERSSMNPFPFKPLPFFAASDMQTVMSSSIVFPENVDGILLFHREAFYISGTNPLCLWILLTQVESLLSMCVAPELLCLQVKPKNLSSRTRHIKMRNSNQSHEMETNQS